jgi:hypothetical protein
MRFGYSARRHSEESAPFHAEGHSPARGYGGPGPNLEGSALADDRPGPARTRLGLRSPRGLSRKSGKGRRETGVACDRAAGTAGASFVCATRVAVKIIHAVALSLSASRWSDATIRP